MLQKSLIRLGSKNVDSASGVEGTITHWEMELGMTEPRYLFQPRGLNPEDGGPLKHMCLTEDRLKQHDDRETVDIPIDILGSQVTDIASGFTGMATAFIRHPNGCFHVDVQPSGKLAKTGAPPRPHNFDIRMLEGEQIPIMTPEEKAVSERKNPSPVAGADFPKREL